MALDTKSIYATLNDLIETAKDGEQGYRDAAENVKSLSLREMFQQYAAERARFAGDLQVHVTRIGGEPAQSGSVAGAAHRGWINLKSAVTDRKDSDIVSEVERGEDVAKAAYQKALENDLPSDLRSVIDSQYQKVLEAHNRVRALETRTSGSASTV